jgi:hypothetical protein
MMPFDRRTPLHARTRLKMIDPRKKINHAEYVIGLNVPKMYNPSRTSAVYTMNGEIERIAKVPPRKSAIFALSDIFDSFVLRNSDVNQMSPVTRMDVKKNVNLPAMSASRK